MITKKPNQKEDLYGTYYTTNSTGFGDIPMTSIYRPTLTTVQEPYYDIGAVSMRTLVKVLKENKIINEKAILGSQIMKRESVKDIN